MLIRKTQVVLRLCYRAIVRQLSAGSQNKGDIDYSGNVKYWADRWSEDQIGFHKQVVNPNLMDHLKSLTDGREDQRFFLPLCGKSLDIPYLCKEGHRVFGVEAVPKAVEDLSDENSLGLKFDPKSSSYVSGDGRILIYCGDIFKCPFPAFGPFDCVWDRGSFSAMEYPFRPAYKEMIQRSLQARDDGSEIKYHDFRYLLETVDYNREKYEGPPQAVNPKDMDEFFRDWTDVEVLKRTEIDPKLVAPNVPDLGEVHQVLYLLKRKV